MKPKSSAYQPIISIKWIERRIQILSRHLILFIATKILPYVVRFLQAAVIQLLYFIKIFWAAQPKHTSPLTYHISLFMDHHSQIFKYFIYVHDVRLKIQKRCAFIQSYTMVGQMHWLLVVKANKNRQTKKNGKSEYPEDNKQEHIHFLKFNIIFVLWLTKSECLSALYMEFLNQYIKWIII